MLITKRTHIFTILYSSHLKISVYQGISPSLLATLSLSQGIKGTTNSQLIASLKKNNIIHSPHLIQSMKKLDRKLFICEKLNKGRNLYQNRPYKIEGGQNMTDVFTHGVVLQRVCERIQQWTVARGNRGLRILDVGTGHGYLGFVLGDYVHRVMAESSINPETEIIGIDSNQKAVSFCQQLKDRLKSDMNNSTRYLKFYNEALEDRMKKPEHFDIIIGGFYMPPSLNQLLDNKLRQSCKTLNRETFGIWPTDSSSGQSLYTFDYKKQGNQNAKVDRNEIMSTMFTMPTVKTGVSKYFIDQNSKQQQNTNQQQLKQTQTQLQTQTQSQTQKQALKKQKQQKYKKQNDILKNQLKMLITKHSQKLNKKLTLQQMRNIEEVRVVLQKLNGRYR